MTALSLEKFSYRHAGAETPALSGIDLSIADGEFVVLAGQSGSGKSTLLRAASGLAPAFDGGTAAGELITCGMNARDNGPAEIARACGTVLQDAERQVVMTSVRAELSLPLESRGMTSAQTAREVEETALLLGLGDLLDRRLDSLSGGELQRVAVGAALAARPRLLLLDEPTAQLDPVAADDLAWLLRRLNEELGIAILVAEQRLERLLPAADRVVVLSEGRVVCDAGPREFLSWAAGHAPALQTPAGALFQLAGLPSPPVTVKEARAELQSRGAFPSRSLPAMQSAEPVAKSGRVLALDSVWDERRDAKALLRGVSLEIAAGEAVALMGRNGAGKSTLLRHAAGLLKPTRGKVRAEGKVVLLPQNPSDCLIGDRVDEIVPAVSLAAAGLEYLGDRNPRDLSGGERQRLALALVTGAGEPNVAAVVLLDEPTRGLDRARRHELSQQIREMTAAGSAVLLATHDAELASETAQRTVLLAEGRLLADASSREVLSGGWHFATETARILDGAGRALLPSEGAELIRDAVDGVVR